MEKEELKPYFKQKIRNSNSDYINYEMHSYRLNNSCNRINWNPPIKI
jgi:hypothetical protein